MWFQDKMWKKSWKKSIFWWKKDKKTSDFDDFGQKKNSQLKKKAIVRQKVQGQEHQILGEFLDKFIAHKQKKDIFCHFWTNFCLQIHPELLQTYTCIFQGAPLAQKCSTPQLSIFQQMLDKNPLEWPKKEAGSGKY